MRLLSRFVCCVSLLLPAAAATADDDLARRIAANDGWVQWQVPLAPDAGEPCCYEVRRGAAGRRGCDLDGRQWSVDDAVPAVTAGARELAVYAHVKAGQVDAIRALSASCPVSSAGAVTRLDGVDPAASVAWLAAETRRDRGRKDDDDGIAAIAFHAAPAAMAALREFAAAGGPRGRREAALFWMGQARGIEGVEAVERVAHEDADAKIRNHAVFVLSQAEKLDTYPRVLAIAAGDRSGEVRGQALFWLAQMEDARAAADIVAALRRETEASVREQAVFALTQLPDEQGDKALIGLMRGDYPREVKQKALFWLGQSGSDTALAFLDETLR
ncbi:HEAT repeat domain-containing protein [Tahibacter caeni]|uniref:HEAT repeat domain-containing protein n=1 Tax=Tahibacter caeni TaxID=1453545 RepID=UPI002148235D|nr:HEAT repeat domain-containing protein [Tahibacter caeni]